MKSSVVILMTMLFIHTQGRAAQADSLMLRIALLEKSIMENVTDTPKVSQLLFEKASLYKNLGDHRNALQTLERIAEGSLGDSLQFGLHYEKAFSAYTIQSFSQSLQEIWAALKYPVKTSEAKVLYLMVLLENERWDDFKTEFRYQSQEIMFVDSLEFLSDFNKPGFLDPELYTKMARVPGAGLIKSGHTGKGVTNIGLQILFAGFAGLNFYHGFYFTGFFSGVQPMRRFYNGGKILTESLVRNRNISETESVKRIGYRYIGELYRRR